MATKNKSKKVPSIAKNILAAQQETAEENKKTEIQETEISNYGESINQPLDCECVDTISKYDEQSPELLKQIEDLTKERDELKAKNEELSMQIVNLETELSKLQAEKANNIATASMPQQNQQLHREPPKTYTRKPQSSSSFYKSLHQDFLNSGYRSWN